MEEGNASSREDRFRQHGTFESRDLVQEASEDSFPASDAPAWNTGF